MVEEVEDLTEVEDITEVEVVEDLDGVVAEVALTDNKTTVLRNMLSVRCYKS